MTNNFSYGLHRVNLHSLTESYILSKQKYFEPHNTTILELPYIQSKRSTTP